MLNGKSACFVDDAFDGVRNENVKRMLDREINLTGCLWGEGQSMVGAQVLALEKSIATEFMLFSTGLEGARLKQERRALRLIPENMCWVIHDNVLEIGFDLSAGAFATMVLRECVNASVWQPADSDSHNP